MAGKVTQNIFKHLKFLASVSSHVAAHKTHTSKHTFIPDKKTVAIPLSHVTWLLYYGGVHNGTEAGPDWAVPFWLSLEARLDLSFPGLLFHNIHNHPQIGQVNNMEFLLVNDHQFLSSVHSG